MLVSNNRAIWRLRFTDTSVPFTYNKKAKAKAVTKHVISAQNLNVFLRFGMKYNPATTR